MRQSALQLRGQTTLRRTAPYAILTILIFVIRINVYGFSETGSKSNQPKTSRQKATAVRELREGMHLKRELKGSDVHAYNFALKVGQFVRVTVDQKGADVVVTVFAPGHKKIMEVDGPNGAWGPEFAAVLAEVNGIFGLEVSGADTGGGKYDIQVYELREATDVDRLFVRGQAAIAEGKQLRAKGTNESLRQSLHKFDEALADFRQLGDKKQEVATLNQIAWTYIKLGEAPKGIEYHNEAVLLTRSLGDRQLEAQTFQTMGAWYHGSAQFSNAIERFDHALRLERAIGHRGLEVETTRRIGECYSALGNQQKALEFLSKALQLKRSMKDLQGEEDILTSIGVSHWRAGDLEAALIYYNQALPLTRVHSNQVLEALTLGTIGLIHRSLGQQQKALQYFNQTLLIRRRLGLKLAVGVSLRNIGATYSSLGQPTQALKYLDQALSIHRQVGDRWNEAMALLQIGEAYSSLARPEEALRYFDQALVLNRAIGDRLNEAATLRDMAQAERDRGRLSVAQTHIEAALKLVENARSVLINQQLRTSFQASKQDYYQFYISLLMRMHRDHPSSGYNIAGLQQNERARARSLLDILTEANVDIREGVDPVLLNQERSLQRQVNDKAERLPRLQSNEATRGQAAAVKEELDVLLTNYEDVEAQIRMKSPRYASLTHPEPLSLKEIQEQVLDDDTLLLEYALGDEHSYLWAVTPDSIKSFELPNRTEIETRTRRVYQLLNSKAESLYPDALVELSQILLGPVANELGKKRLAIVGEGALQSLPFGALPVPSGNNGSSIRREAGPSAKYEPLILQHEITYLPSASVIAVLRNEVPRRRVALNKLVVFADPVFDKNDERVVSNRTSQHARRANKTAPTALTSDVERSLSDFGITKFERLPTSRREANQITSFISNLNSLKELDFYASRANLFAASIDEYQIVHFATHSLLNNRHPELSGIVLSLVNERGEPQNGFLRLHEIYNLKLKSDLVVLSACQTALGKEIKGEGLVGLTRGFMYAGAPRVVASLWKVSDSATAELMTRFYENMLTRGMRPAAALRAAQLSLSKEKQWTAPYYWAGFILQGEWR